MQSVMTIADTIYEKLKTAPAERARDVLDFLEFLEAKSARARSTSARSWDDLMGTLAGSPLVEGDRIAVQRQLRDEWDHFTLSP
jgi:Protein of unknown function (DUF2281)